MATKIPTSDQHAPLHNLWPDNCCLCRAEQKIKELEREIKRLKEEKDKMLERCSVDKLTNIISNYCRNRGFTEYTDCATFIHNLIAKKQDGGEE